jgi:hypothetical protein
MNSIVKAAVLSAAVPLSISKSEAALAPHPVLLAKFRKARELRKLRFDNPVDKELFDKRLRAAFSRNPCRITNEDVLLIGPPDQRIAPTTRTTWEPIELKRKLKKRMPAKARQRAKDLIAMWEAWWKTDVGAVYKETGMDADCEICDQISDLGAEISEHRVTSLGDLAIKAMMAKEWDASACWAEPADDADWDEKVLRRIVDDIIKLADMPFDRGAAASLAPAA